MYNLLNPHYMRFEDRPTISNQNSGILDAPTVSKQHVGDVAAALLLWKPVYAPTQGITVLSDNQPVAVVNLNKNNPVIWLVVHLATNQSELLLGITHSLILSSWMDER